MNGPQSKRFDSKVDDTQGKSRFLATAPPFGIGGSPYWSLIVVLIAVLILLPNVCYPMGPDQSLFAVIGRGLLEGRHLYVDLWDVKPPGIFCFYALVVRIFDSAMWSVGVCDAILAMLVSYLTFLFGRRFIGSPGAALGAITAAAWHARGGHWTAIQAEELLVLFVLAAFFLLTPQKTIPHMEIPRSVLGGIMFGCAFWIKYVALAFLPLLILLPFVVPRRGHRTWRLCFALDLRPWVRTIASFMSGFLATAAIAVGLLLVQGAWKPFMESSQVLPKYSLQYVRLYGSSYPLWAWTQTVHGLGAVTLLGSLLAIVLAWKNGELAKVAPIIIGSVLSYAAVAGQFRFNSYTFEMCYPFFALLRGYLVFAVLGLFFSLSLSIRRYLKGRIKLARALVLGIVVLLYVGLEIRGITARYAKLVSWLSSPQQSYAQDYWSGVTWNMSDQERVVSLILSRPGAHSVFVWGNASLIYFQTHAIPPMRFVSNTWLQDEWALPHWRREVERAFLNQLPEYVVVARNDVDRVGLQDSSAALASFKFIDAALETEYHLEGDFTRFRVYRRNSESL